MSTQNITTEYLDYQDKYQSIYGENTIILMMVGGFYEAYCTENRGYDLAKIADLLNIKLTKKERASEVTISNPYMLGFPIAALHKFLKVLIENGYHVVMVDQVTQPPKPKRAVTQIYSPGTYIENVSLDNNNIVSVYAVEEKQKLGNVLFCIGLSAIDLSTGSNVVYEVYSTKEDENFALDETNRFINTYNPKEIIITHITVGKMTEEELIAYLEINDTPYNYNTVVPKNCNRITYQQQFLGNIFDKQLSSIEYLDLELINYGRMSYILLLQYAIDHNMSILKNINRPTRYQSNKYMNLGNNAMFQLNIIDNNTAQSSKYKSLFDIVNMTTTPIGRRFLKDSLLSPLIDENKLNQRYNAIDRLRKDKLFSQIEEELKPVLDIERLHRKIGLGYLNPSEFDNIHYSYIHIRNIIKLVEECDELKILIPENIKNNQLDNFITDYTEKLELDMMRNYLINEIDNSIFKKKVYPNIDKLQSQIDKSMNIMKNIAIKLSSLIGIVNYFDTTDTDVKLVESERDGYYLQTTKTKALKIQNILKEQQTLDIDELTIDVNDIDIIHSKGKSSVSKIYIPKIKEISDNLIDLRNEMKYVVKEQYVKLLFEWYDKYQNLFNSLVYFVGLIDFLKSGAKVSILNKYTKPIIKTSDNAYIKCEKLRHPIIEKLINSEYIPHDLILGKDNMVGILLYGVNSSGKTAIAKAIGLSTILAQIGYYVPAKSYEYSPFENIFTRISGTDNLFKGLSSFAMEMLELQAILRRCGTKSLVLADELCRGTEVESANIIVLAIIEMLSKTNTCFISATHLHELYKFDRFKNIKNVKCFHLDVEFDEENDRLVYTRHLLPGPGKEFYGLTVAKYLIHDKSFIDLTNTIKKELMGDFKTSIYNKDLIVDKCAICSHIPKKGEIPLQTHHIKEQHTADENGFVDDHLHKDELCNLVVLCEKCHDMVDNPKDGKKLYIYGYKDTSNGMVLNWEIKDFVKTKKTDNNIVKLVQELKGNKLSQLRVKDVLKLRGINIGINEIRKMWNVETI